MLYYLNLLLEVLIRIWLVCHWKGLAPSSGGTATQGWRKKGRRRVGGLVAGRPVKDSSSAHRGRHPITRAKEKLFQATILSIQSWGENQDRQQLSSINAARKYASVSQLFQWQTFSTFVRALCQTKLDKQQQQQRSITAGTSLSSCCWRWAGFGFVRSWVGFGRALITQHLYQPPLFGTNHPSSPCSFSSSTTSLLSPPSHSPFAKAFQSPINMLTTTCRRSSNHSFFIFHIHRFASSFRDRPYQFLNLQVSDECW